MHTRALIARSQRIADQLRDKETNNRHTLATVFDQRSQLLVEHRRQLDKFERDLDVQRQKLACALFTVFPIAKIQRRSTDSVAPSMARNNVNQALAEATATQFVDGRWVFIDGDELFDKVSHYFTVCFGVNITTLWVRPVLFLINNLFIGHFFHLTGVQTAFIFMQTLIEDDEILLLTINFCLFVVKRTRIQKFSKSNYLFCD